MAFIGSLVAAQTAVAIGKYNAAVNQQQAAYWDKKAQAHQLRFVLLRSIGDAYVSTDYSEPRLNKILEKVNA